MEQSDVINFSRLEKELQSIVDADREHARINDAKCRAIRQKCASYEEFRDIVQASHLKPLDKKEIAGAARKQPWNSIAAGNKHGGVLPEDLQADLTENPPKTSSEFTRDWRRFAGSSSEKYAFLLKVGGKALREIFSYEVGFGLLGEFILIFSQCLKQEDAEQALDVLEGLSGTGRFELSVSLLSQAERKACLELFHKLQVRNQAINSDGVSTISPERGEASGVCEASAPILNTLMEKYGVLQSC